MKLWIARDKNGSLYLHTVKPVKQGGVWYTDTYFGSKQSILLRNDNFSNVTFEDKQPQQVELISTEEYKHLKECEEICKTESDYGDKHYC